MKNNLLIIPRSVIMLIVPSLTGYYEQIHLEIYYSESECNSENNILFSVLVLSNSEIFSILNYLNLSLN